MNKKISLTVNDMEKPLSEWIQEAGHDLSTPCGGCGSCGKCRVRFPEHPPEPSMSDRALLSQEEINAGVRLACQAYVEGLVSLELLKTGDERIEAEDSFAITGEVPFSEGGEGPVRPEDAAIAVDLGTTTIAAVLVDRENKRILARRTATNRQRAFGADVVTRISAANEGQEAVLTKLVREDVERLCGGLAKACGLQEEKIPVVISGNTTMQHILQGLPCRGLAGYPFAPEDISLHGFEHMTMLPGISAFIGADVVSGIIACGMDRSEKISILVDLGTNGEMVIGNRKRMLAASAAAGPAFEGGNISCGLAGVSGAIDRVRIRNGRAEFTTIGDQPALGLCGTGVLETVYELVRSGIVDETGLMADPYFEKGFPLTEKITFSARDVREVQMAKSAVRTGIEILLDAYGVTCADVENLYLAGGFGRRINGEKAVAIGMLPTSLADRIVPVGNSSLMGAAMFAMEGSGLQGDMAERFKGASKITEEILLANSNDFQDRYLSYMSFEL